MRANLLLSLLVVALLGGLLVAVHEARRAPAPASAGSPRPAASAAETPDGELVDEGSCESLTAGERAVVDRGRDLAGWDEIHAAFSAGEPPQAARDDAETRAIAR